MSIYTFSDGELLTAAKLNQHCVNDNPNGDPWKAYTPALTGSGWALGNGTITGVYYTRGRITFFQVRLEFGSTTVAGSGWASFSTPSPIMYGLFAGSGVIQNSGSIRVLGGAAVGGSAVSPLIAASNGGVTSGTVQADPSWLNLFGWYRNA